jgi:hypothetical protein
MSDTMHQPRWRRWLDGGHTWGSLTVSLPRYGVTRYRLVVFPPGISADDRMLLRAWRTWPGWGLAGFLALEILLAPTIGSGTALWLATAGFLGSGAILVAKTARNRGGVRTLSVTRMAGAEDGFAAERQAELHALACELAIADRRLAAGEINAAEHERVVWHVYDRLATAA